MSENATPGATATSEDSVSQAAESSRPQELLEEIEVLKQIIARTAKTRDDYRDDYYRVHQDYMDFKYPSSRPKTAKPLSREQIANQISQHAQAMIDLTKITRLQSEPPHCPSCDCETS